MWDTVYCATYRKAERAGGESPALESSLAGIHLLLFFFTVRRAPIRDPVRFSPRRTVSIHGTPFVWIAILIMLAVAHRLPWRSVWRNLCDNLYLTWPIGKRHAGSHYCKVKECCDGLTFYRACILIEILSVTFHFDLFILHGEASGYLVLLKDV